MDPRRSPLFQPWPLKELWLAGSTAAWTPKHVENVEGLAGVWKSSTFSQRKPYKRNWDCNNHAEATGSKQMDGNCIKACQKIRLKKAQRAPNQLISPAENCVLIGVMLRFGSLQWKVAFKKSLTGKKNMQQSPLVSTCCRSITFNLWSSKSNSHRPQSGEGFWSFRIPAMHPRNFGPENERKFEWEPSQICQPSNEQIQILTTWRNLGAMQGTRSSCAYAAASGEQHLACWEMYARSVELCTFPSNVSCFRCFSSWTVPSIYLFEASALGKDIWNNAPFLEMKIAPQTSPHKGHKRTAADGCAAVRSFGMALRNGFLMLARDLQEGHVIMGQWAWHGKNHRLFVPNFNDAKSPNLPCFIFQIQLEKQNLLRFPTQRPHNGPAMQPCPAAKSSSTTK